MNINFSIKSFLVIFYLLCSSLEGSGQDGVRFYDEHVMDGYTNEINIISNDISPDYEVIVMESGNYLCVGRREF